jgi:hypothetical protein
LWVWVPATGIAATPANPAIPTEGASVYMVAVCAIQHNPVMKEFYTRLLEVNHRPKKVALTAVMKKLLIVANSTVKNSDFVVV